MLDDCCPPAYPLADEASVDVPVAVPAFAIAGRVFRGGARHPRRASRGPGREFPAPGALAGGPLVPPGPPEGGPLAPPMALPPPRGGPSQVAGTLTPPGVPGAGPEFAAAAPPSTARPLPSGS